MKDCDCEKKEVEETWLDKNDYGDEFLREENFKIINRILRDRKYYSINHDAVFNIKLDQDEINEMSLEDVNIDYSYLKDKNFKMLEEDGIELLEENESTSSEFEEDNIEEINSIEDFEKASFKIALDNIDSPNYSWIKEDIQNNVELPVSENVLSEVMEDQKYKPLFKKNNLPVSEKILEEILDTEVIEESRKQLPKSKSKSEIQEENFQNREIKDIVKIIDKKNRKSVRFNKL